MSSEYDPSSPTHHSGSGGSTEACELEDSETQGHAVNSVPASAEAGGGNRKVMFGMAIEHPTERSHSARSHSRFEELLLALESEHKLQLRLAKSGHSFNSQPSTAIRSEPTEQTQATCGSSDSKQRRHKVSDTDGKEHKAFKRSDEEDRISVEESSGVNLVNEGSLPRSISGNSVFSRMSRSQKRIRTVRGLNAFRLLRDWSEPISTSMSSLRSSARTSNFASTFDQTHQAPKALVESSEHPLVQKLVLHPTSTRRLIWDLVGMVLLVYDILSIPFISAFHPDEGAAIVVLSFATCFFWTFDMVLSFFTGYINVADNIIVLEPLKIGLRYLRTWFLLDIVIVTLDWIIILTAGGNQGSVVRFGRSLRTLRFIRTFRLVRVVKLKKLIQLIQDEISSEGVSICFGVLQVVFWLLVSNHMVGCCWYAVGSIEKDGIADGWVVVKNMEARSMVYQYATSLHWSLAQFTPAPNEIFPQNEYERIFATAVLVFAMVAFSSFVSSLTTAMMQLRNLLNEQTRNFWILRRYLRDWKVRTPVKHRTLRYLEYAFQRHQQKVQEKDVKLLGLLSQPLQEELRQDTLKMHLFDHPLFNVCKRHVRVFSKALSLCSYARCDKFFECGEQATNMLFIASGEMEYYLGELAHFGELDQHLREDEGELLEFPSLHMTPEATPEGNEPNSDETAPTLPFHLDGELNDWVCEPVLWTTWTHLGDLYAITECQIVSIDSGSFVQGVRMNLPIWQYMTHYAKKFISQLNTLPAEKLTDLIDRELKPEVLTGKTKELDNLFQEETHRYLRFHFCPWMKQKATGSSSDSLPPSNSKSMA